MKYDFDREINRKDTQSAKWGVIQDPDNPSRWHATDDYYGEERVLPLWVADMDFPAPQPVVDALVRRARHGIYGYTIRTADHDRAVVDWMKRRHGWAIEPGWIDASLRLTKKASSVSTSVSSLTSSRRAALVSISAGSAPGVAAVP